MCFNTEADDAGDPSLFNNQSSNTLWMNQSNSFMNQTGGAISE